MRILTVEEAADRVGKHPRTLKRWEAAGLFPRRRQLAPHSVGYLESEVVEWIESRPPVQGADR
jgi:predicted DNA-binding transcriptional regulator AlpA